MSILGLFKKPNWKNKDINIRAIAVSTESSPELIAQLSHISQHDESSKVRTSALKRLTDYNLIANIGKNDSDKMVKSAAYKMLQDWFGKSNGESVDAEQLSIISKISDLNTLESAASKSSNKQIRAFCIGKITKQGLLADLLIAEKDRELRQIIVDKIDKPATLKRLLKSFKNKDKNILKAIQAKLESDGDMTKIINKKALDLCESMEKLIHNPSTSSQSDVNFINNKWQELSKQHDLSSFTQRYAGAYRTANLTFDPKQRDAFLDQQRKQKVTTKLNELLVTIKDGSLGSYDSWEKVQTQISKYSGFDLSHASPEQKSAFEHALAELKTWRDSKSKEQELPKKLLTVADKLDAALKHKYNQPNQITEFRKMWNENARKAKNNAAFSTLKNRFDNAMLKLAENIESSAILRDEAAKMQLPALQR
ncbi:MAG: hypothetical protein L3J83_06890 [Proteobacteria bacterium]|nr:hypothetical protein [Pseudomonadota bacterium]